jgi:hypothetical protein
MSYGVCNAGAGVRMACGRGREPARGRFFRVAATASRFREARLRGAGPASDPSGGPGDPWTDDEPPVAAPVRGTRGRAARVGCAGRAAWKANDPLARVARSTSSISRVLFRTEIALDAAAVIPLGRPLPDASSSLPADSSESPSTADPLARVRRTSAYVALLPMGSALPSPLPETRWALTPPFHPGLPLVSVAGRARQVVSSLLHFPSRFHDRALPGIVLFGARTFLPPRFVAPNGLAAYRSDWFTTGDRLYGIDGGQGATGSLAPQWGGCVSWGG